MANQEPVIFYCDFRSPPSGLGTFGDDILVQDTGSCPSVPDNVYSEVIKLNYSSTEDRQGFVKFIDMLVAEGVTHVYDSELETRLARFFKDKCYPIHEYKKEVILIHYSY